MSHAACWDSALIPNCPTTIGGPAAWRRSAEKVLTETGYELVDNFGAFKEWSENGGSIDKPIEPVLFPDDQHAPRSLIEDANSEFFLK
jgi:trimethylamine:corrinoid methyltransferase-like protein